MQDEYSARAEMTNVVEEHEAASLKSSSNTGFKNCYFVEGRSGLIDLSKEMPGIGDYLTDLGKVETSFRMFRANEKLENGQYVYFVAIESRWKPAELTIGKAALQSMNNTVRARDVTSNVEFVDWSPNAHTNIEQRPVEISTSVMLPSGAGASASVKTHVRAGRQHASVDPGMPGHYTMKFDSGSDAPTDPLTTTALIQLRSDEEWKEANLPWDHIKWEANAEAKRVL